jgi:AcrR family transcriptional regulator
MGTARLQLTRDAIAVAALELLKHEGPEALSFRRVAGQLGASHTTIHRHCANFDGLLDICADYLAGELPAIDWDAPWAEAMERCFTALYEIWTNHSALLALRQGRPWWVPNMLTGFAEPTLRVSLANGMTPPEALQAIRQMYLFTLGCSVTHASYSARQARPVIAALDPDAFPTLTTHMNAIVAGPPERDVFTQGLRNLIAAAAAGPARCDLDRIFSTVPPVQL